MKLVLKIIGIFIAIMILIVVLKVVLLPVFIASKAVDSVTGIIDQTLDADNVIYNYEWFKQTYNDILASDKRINIAELTLTTFNISLGERSEWTFEDKQEHSRLSATLQGLRSYRAGLVGDYNARSMMVNREIFKGKDVPIEIE